MICLVVYYRIESPYTLNRGPGGAPAWVQLLVMSLTLVLVADNGKD